LAELAVFGYVGILALSFIIQMGLRMNYDQEIRMNTFRRTLVDALNDNLPADAKDRDPRDGSYATSYHQFRDRQMPNPAGGFGLILRERTAAESDVTWGNYLTYGSPDLSKGRSTQQRIFVQVNNSVADCFPDSERVCYASDFAATSNEPLIKNVDVISHANSTTTQSNGSTSVHGTSSADSVVTLSNGVTINGSLSKDIAHDF